MSCTIFGAGSSNFGAKIVLFFEVSKRKMSNLNKKFNCLTNRFSFRSFATTPIRQITKAKYYTKVQLFFDICNRLSA